MGNAREIRSKHLPNRHLTLFCFKHHGNANQLLSVQRIPVIPLKNLIDRFPAKLVRINTISGELEFEYLMLVSNFHLHVASPPRRMHLNLRAQRKADHEDLHAAL